jgi:crotonobetainyl-CoA:carnitine CoA-transferase CaiB-like acyl-CoA transferase
MSDAAMPLDGLKVLDIGTRIAAPFAAGLLADFGAEVVKIERPDGGDFMREIGPFDDGQSLWWAVEGRGKKSITLDLRKPEGQEILKRLVPHFDVLVENFRPGTLERWNIGPEVLAKIHPGLIVSRVSVYGQTGPYRNRPGLDRNGIAMGGLLHITGEADRPPVRPGIVLSDYLTGVFNAFAIMVAIFEREKKSGEGQTIDLALYGSVLRILEHTIAAYDRLGVVRGRHGNRLPNSAPLDNWQTKDGAWISLVAAGDGLFPRLARLIERAELLEDPRFATAQARVENADEINEIVAIWCRRHTSAEIEERAVAGDVPFARAFTAETIATDPHIEARGDLTRVEDPVLGSVQMQGVFPRLSRTPGQVRSGAPELGAHNAEIYGELLGIAGEALAALGERGIV